MSVSRAVFSSGSSYVDDVLASRQWDGEKITFGFASSSTIYSASYGRGEAGKGFAALNASQKAAAQDAMKLWGELVAIDLVAASAAEADIRLAVSSMPATAWAYTPSSSVLGGDIWLGTASFMANATKGNYGYLTIMHEIGHALGLSHPHEKTTLLAGGMIADEPGEGPGEGLCPCCAGAVHGPLNGAFAAQEALSDAGATQVAAIMASYQGARVVDAMAFSVMSYRSYTGADTTKGYLNETFGYAQTPMARDIAAIQHLYGANYETRSGDTVYRWSETSGEKSINGVGQGKPGANKVFETVWDGGGRDTFDLSNHKTGVTVDLAPGGWTNFNNSQIASLGNGNKAPGNVAVAHLHEGDARALIENAIGGAGNDDISGNIASNVLVGGAGNDTLRGVSGNNVLIGDGLGNELALIGLARADIISVAIGAVDKGGNDILLGGTGNDVFIPGLGKNTVRGGEGADTLILDLLLSDLKITGSTTGTLTISYAGGSLEATGVEFLAVRDGIYSLIGPLEELAERQFSQEIMLLYRAGLGRDIDSGGLEYWANALENGNAMDQMALSLIDSAEFSQRFGAPQDMGDADFVAVLYQNVLGRNAAAPEVDYWHGQMEQGAERAQILLAFAQSDENRANVEAGTVPENIPDDLDLVAITQAQWAQLWG
jgi:serralysin